MFVLPSQDEAGRAQPSDDRRILRRHVLGEGPARVGRADARGVGQILDRDRDAAKGPVRKLRTRLRQSLLVTKRDEGVEARLDRLQAPKGLLDELGGRDLAPPDAFSKLERAAQTVRPPICQTGPCVPTGRESLSARRTRAVPRMPFASQRSRQRLTIPGEAP